MSDDIKLYPRGALPAAAFDRSAFVREWKVVWSTLPLWRDKQDVRITYAATPNNDDHTTVSSDVSYRALESTVTKHVKGTERLVPGTTGSWVWRGDGWLCWCTSRWEVRGCGRRGAHGEVEWCVISFEKTLFTPSGVDILLRGPARERAAVVAELLAAFEGIEDLKGVVGDGKDVPHSDE